MVRASADQVDQLKPVCSDVSDLICDAGPDTMCALL